MIVVNSEEFRRIKKVLGEKQLCRDEKGDCAYTCNVKGKRNAKRYAIRADKYKLYLAQMHKFYKITDENGREVSGTGLPIIKNNYQGKKK